MLPLPLIVGIIPKGYDVPTSYTGSAAIDQLILYILLPAALLYFFRQRVMLYAVTAFWISSLFALSLKLKYAIPEAFAGANLTTPQWAGNLIVLFALVSILFITAVMLTKLYHDNQNKNLASFTTVFILLGYSLALFPILLTSSLFFAGHPLASQLIESRYTTLLWEIPVIFAIILDYTRLHISKTVNHRILAGSAFLFIIGAAHFYWFAIKTKIMLDLTFDDIPFINYYKGFILVSIALFVTALFIAFWNNRKQP